MATSTEIDPTTPQGGVREPIYAIEPAAFSACESIEAEMEEITYRVNLLRLATREEILSAMGTTKLHKGSESATRFLLNLFADERELKVTDIEAAIAERNAKAASTGKPTWISPLKTILTNTNTMTRNTCLKLRVRNGRNGGTWRLESKKVQAEHEISADKREAYIDSSSTRHKKVLETAAKTEDKKTKCLLQLVAQQTAGVRLAEIVEVFDGTLNLQELIEFIKTTNTEMLAPIDTKIHLRNGIAIIGPCNPHWESSVGEPILVNSMDSIYELATRNRRGTSAKIKTVLLNKETPEQTIARLTEENLRLQAAVDRSEKPIAEEARTKDLSAKLQEISRDLINTKKLLDKANRDAEEAEASRVEAKKAIERKNIVLEKDQSEEIARLEKLLRNTIARARDAEDRSANLAAQLRDLKTTQVDSQTLATFRQQTSETPALRAQLEASRTRVQTLEARVLELESHPKEPAKPAETKALKARIPELEAQLTTLRAQIEELRKENTGLQELLESATNPAGTTADTDSLSTQPPAPTTDTALQPATTATQPTAASSAQKPTQPTTAPTASPTAAPAKPPESPSPVQDMENTKTFKKPEDLYDAVERAVNFGKTLHPQGMPKGTLRRIKRALRELRNLPPPVESAKTRLLSLLEKMQGQGEIIPLSEIETFLASTL